MTLKVVKPAPELTPEQAALVADIRSLLDRAIRGEVVGVFGVSVARYEDDVEVCEPVITGDPGDVADLMRRLGHLISIVDGIDGDSWLEPADDDDA